MSAKSRNAIAGLSVLSVVGMASPALAQMPTPAGQAPSVTPPGAQPRIEVSPRPLLYRRCAGWYVLQYRPSGTVLFPQKHCWWVRG
jgi:hypothetical protein